MLHAKKIRNESGCKHTQYNECAFGTFCRWYTMCSFISSSYRCNKEVLGLINGFDWEVDNHKARRAVNLFKLYKKINAEEKSSFTFDDAMAFVASEAVLA